MESPHFRNKPKRGGDNDMSRRDLLRSFVRKNEPEPNAAKPHHANPEHARIAEPAANSDTSQLQQSGGEGESTIDRRSFLRAGSTLAAGALAASFFKPADAHAWALTDKAIIKEVIDVGAGRQVEALRNMGYTEKELSDIISILTQILPDAQVHFQEKFANSHPELENTDASLALNALASPNMPQSIVNKILASGAFDNMTADMQDRYENAVFLILLNISSTAKRKLGHR